MSVEARIKKDGSLIANGEINERLPVVTNGLVAYYPLDNSFIDQNMPFIPSTAKVLGYYVGASHPSYDWFNTNTTLTNTTDIINTSIATAKNYDLVIADGHAWEISAGIIDVLKTFVDAGVSVIASGNDARLNTFVLEYNATSHGSYTTTIDNNIVGLNNLVYAAYDSDLYGGITKLTDNCIPYMRRSDDNTIVGYFYLSPISGAVLFYNQGASISSQSYDFITAANLFAYNRSNGRITNQNTVSTTDGVGVQPAIINLVTSVAKDFSNWAGLTGSTSYFTAPNGKTGIELIAGSSGGVQWAHTNSITAYGSSVYTISYKVKATSWNTVSVNLFYIREYDSGGAQLREAGHFSNSNKYKLDNGYYQTYATFTTQPNTVRFVLQSFEYAPVQICAYDLQIEKSTSFSPYVSGSTSASLLSIPNPVMTGDYTINFNARILNNIGDAVQYQTLMCMGSYYSYNSWTIMDTNGTSVGGSQSLTRRGNGGEWNWAFYDLTTSPNIHDFNNITVVKDSTNYLLYSNGVYVGSLAHLSTTMQDKIWIGSRHDGSSIGTAIFNGISIYNRVLSPSEISNLYGNNFKVDSKYVTTNQITEAPSILDEGFYFPLASDGYDTSGSIGPSNSSNVLFEDSSAYVGTQITNLIPQTGEYTVAGGGTIPVIISSPNLVVYSHDYSEYLTWTYHGYSGIPITNGSTYNYSLDAIITKDFDYTGSTVFISDGEGGLGYGFDYNTSDLGKWKRFSSNAVASNTTGNVYLYPNTDNKYSNKGKIYYKNWMLVNKIYRPAFCTGTTGASKLQYNLNSSIGLDWASNWSICYWKKPVATTTDNLTGYSLDSLGCNGNTVGGGYVWWGKNSGSDTLYSSIPSGLTSATYFNNWQFISIVKSGTTVTITTILSDGTVSVRISSNSSSLANYYVTQHGYDLFLGGYDNGNPCNTYFRDLIVVKRSLTDTELTNIYKQFSVTKLNIYAQNLIEQGI